MNSYLEKNRKALSKIFNSDQIEVLEKSKDMLKKQAVMERAGKGTNSDSTPKLMENLAEKSGSKASTALFGVGGSFVVKGALDYVKNIGESGKIKYLEKALLDPKMAKFLLKKDTETHKNFFDSLGNKDDFAKWLRDSDGIFESVGNSIKEVGKNFSITSQSISKAVINDDK